MAKSLALLLKEAGELLESKEFAEAILRYREISTMQPGNAAAAMGLAMVYNRTGQPELALQMLQGIWNRISTSRAKNIKIPKAAVLAQIGLAQELLGRFTDALASFKQSHALLQSSEIMEKIRKLEGFISNPQTIGQIIFQAGRLRREGAFENSKKFYMIALQMNPDHPDALHGLGLTLRSLKDFDGALPLIQQAIMLAPDRVVYYNDLGILFQDRGELDKAISFHRRALKVDPEFVPAYINLGVAHKRMGNLDEAINCYRKAIALNPNTPAAHNNLGNLLRSQGKLADAKKEIQQAVKLWPDYQDAIRNLAAIEEEERQANIR